MTGITVTKVDEMKAAFDQALELTKAGKPALIDVKITNERPIPVEKLTLILTTDQSESASSMTLRSGTTPMI